MLNIKRLGHVLIRTSDLERLTKFYQETLGLELVEIESEGHNRMAFLTLGEYGHTIDLVEIEASKLSKPDNSTLHHLGFQVDSFEDLKSAYFKLLDDGYEIYEATDHVTQKSIYFKDPDGNRVEIYHELDSALDIFRSGRGDADEPLTFER